MCAVNCFALAFYGALVPFAKAGIARLMPIVVISIAGIYLSCLLLGMARVWVFRKLRIPRRCRQAGEQIEARVVELAGVAARPN